MIKHIIVVMAITGVAAAQTAPLVPLFPVDGKVHAAKALDALGMTMADAGFEKDHGKPLWALNWIANTLSDPWKLPGYAEDLYTSAESNDPAAWWAISAKMLEVESTSIQVDSVPTDRDDVEINHVLEQFLKNVENTRAALDKAFSGLTQEERAYLAASLLGPAFEAEDNDVHHAALIAAGMPDEVLKRIEAEARQLDGTADSQAWLALVGRVDLSWVHQASHTFYSAVMDVKNQCARMTNWPDEVLVRETEFGLIVIGTERDDVHNGPALLVLDPGGNDVYLNRAGAANGLRGQPLAAIVDLGGNDRYRSSDVVGAGAALWGVSIVWDASGDDVYEADYIGSGAAIYGGAWLEDVSGNDLYRGHAIGQGAGIVGFGYLIDHAGDDTYDIGFYGQGFAGVKGWGLLLDRVGNDRYLAGNRRLDHERNDERYLSLAQGFSIGMRPHAGGGVAALVDLSGNDFYSGDIYAQGVSYYYSAGFLLDGGGHDRYSVYQYGQGCGIHLSLGLMADAWGNDFYTGYILVQGAAHDYAVGMMFDHAGDDTYTADHHAQGRALNNAFALLVDRDGNDAYFGRQRDGAQGIGNNGGFRDYGSLAMLLDLGGTDVYSGGFSNSVTTLRPLYGVIYDHEDDDHE